MSIYRELTVVMKTRRGKKKWRRFGPVATPVRKQFDDRFNPNTRVKGQRPKRMRYSQKDIHLCA